MAKSTRANGRKNKIRILIVLFVILFLVASFFTIRAYLFYRYPLEHQTYIEQYAKEFGLDPYLVASVIWAESGYRETVRSEKSAVGLMQIMPDTGTWIAGKLGISDYQEADLLDPQTNIRFGCWYLAYLEEKFEGDEVKGLAGYNAGPGRVDEWEEDLWGGESYRPTYEDIPFPETKNYVKKIQKAQKIYKYLYTFE